MPTPAGTTSIGESILINGSLNGDEDLTVDGRVEGALTLTKTLVVGPRGIVKAEVQVKNCVIAGVVVGNVIASESVEITEEGRMVGDIAAPRVIIVDGASFRGRVDMGDLELPRGERPTRPAIARPPARPALVPAKSAKAGKKEEAQAEKAAPKGPPSPPSAMGMGAVKKKVVVRRR